MLRRTLQGLTFKVFSPSLFELDNGLRDCEGSDIDTVAVAFVNLRWYIEVLMKKGHSIHRGPFRSRDEAIALLADRRAA